MKKFLFSIMAFTALLVVGCTEESSTDFSNQESAQDLNTLAARGTVWNGTIGIVENGIYKITADQQAIRADFESVLLSQGTNTQIQTLEIKKLSASNDPTDFTYMLIGADGVRSSIGVFLSLSKDTFTLSPSHSSYASCEGCPQGCNLNYLIIEGKRVPFCNEMGCYYDCSKTETGFY